MTVTRNGKKQSFIYKTMNSVCWKEMLNGMRHMMHFYNLERNYAINKVNTFK